MLVFEPNCWPAFFDFGGKGTNYLIHMQLTAKIPQLCSKNAEQPQKLTAIAPQKER